MIQILTEVKVCTYSPRPTTSYGGVYKSLIIPFDDYLLPVKTDVVDRDDQPDLSTSQMDQVVRYKIDHDDTHFESEKETKYDLHISNLFSQLDTIITHVRNIEAKQFSFDIKLSDFKKKMIQDLKCLSKAISVNFNRIESLKTHSTNFANVLFSKITKVQ